MHIRLTVADAAGVERDFDVSAADSWTFADFADRMGLDEPRYSGARRVPGRALLGGPGLRTGDILTPVATAAEGSLAPLRLAVVGGPNAGRVMALGTGRYRIGRDPSCELAVDDPDVSRVHAELVVDAGGMALRDLRSTNGTYCGDLTITATASPLSVGQVVRLGSSLLCVGSGGDPPSAVRPSVDGTVVVNRPPRLDATPDSYCVELPASPRTGTANRMQWLAAFMPAAMGAGMAAYLHNVQFLAFSLLSPIVMIGGGISDRMHGRRSRRRQLSDFQRLERDAQAELASKLADEVHARRRRHPDAVTALRTAIVPDCNLWQCRPDDPDHLEIRIGLGSASSILNTRRDGVITPAAVLTDVPVTIALHAGALGLCGPAMVTAAIARGLVAQLAVTHSPIDVEIALLVSAETEGNWTWTRWLPHLGGRIANTPEGRRELAGRLRDLVEARRARAQGRIGTEATWTGPWLVVVIDRASHVAELPGLQSILALGPSAGVTAICIDDTRRRLPTACASLASVSGETGALVEISEGSAPRQVAVSDQMSTQVATSISRALGPLVDSASDGASTIPSSCQLLDLLDRAKLTASTLAERWREHRGPRAELGLCSDGVFTVDLVADGPHALVAGTTGSGKSELLQTLIAALAMANSPQQLAFVLIDYKGGAAFADCARLPHTAGLVTDLDAQLTERALVSLDAELRRREAIFADAGAKDLEQYQREHDDLARLVLVVDEFAALAEELPAFMSGLIAIAQRGRSLGVHLVLATQRPGGVISPEIRANTSLRIALRVTDAAESSDVVGVADAADIAKDTPGRAFVRAGSTLAEIQTARVGGTSAAHSSGLAVLPLDEWGSPIRAECPEPRADSDLHILVELAREAARSEGLPDVTRPWLTPLPTRLALNALENSDNSLQLGWGLVDDPARQAQTNLVFRLDEATSVLVVGAPRSGRSSALRTLALSAASALVPRQLHLYVIDCAGGSLADLAPLENCGAVLTQEHPDAIATLSRKLVSELRRRQASAQRGTQGSAHVLVLIDGWESLVAASDEYDAGGSTDRLLTLVREGPAVGMTAVLAGGRAALTARLASCVGEKLILRMADSTDYALAGIAPRSVPASMPAGRALRATDGLVAQFALCGPGAELIPASLDPAADAPVPAGGRGTGPFVVRPLPGRIRLADLACPAPRAATSAAPLRIGVGGDNGALLSVDLFSGDGRWLVSGPARSGRTSTLRTLLSEASRTKLKLAVAAPLRSQLGEDAEQLRIPLLRPDSTEQVLRTFGCVFGSAGPHLLLIDDSEAFAETAVAEALCGLIRDRAGGRLAVAVAAKSEDLALTFRGVAGEVRRSRNGVLLQPAPGDGDLLGARLGRVRAAQIPGRGILVTEQPQSADSEPGVPIAIQVALP